MTDFEKVMMNRDGMTAKEAKHALNKAEKALYAILNKGGGYNDVEEFMLDEYGLEMDYIMDLL